jgi:undecaprenyl diphosphate synthase
MTAKQLIFQDPPDDLLVERLPRHVAVFMDGNGRWAKRRGMPRIMGHRRGVDTLKDLLRCCRDWGVEALTAYAFSTENWKRTPEEVRFLMGFNREVLRRRRDQLNEWGVRVRWAGRRPKLWLSVIDELKSAEALTAKNSALTLTMCVNYGSRVEITDAVNEMSKDIVAGKLKAGSITDKTMQRYLNTNYLPDVDLFLRSSGEQRASNFLLWQSAYAEFVFMDTLWPDFNRSSLWDAIGVYVSRDRRFGGAVDKPKTKNAK